MSIFQFRPKVKKKWKKNCIHSDPAKLFLSNLAFEGFDWKVDNHVGFEGLFLDEGLKADVALERSHTGVDQHVALQIG